MVKRRVFVRRHLRRGRPVRAHFASYAEEHYLSPAAKLRGSGFGLIMRYGGGRVDEVSRRMFGKDIHGFNEGEIDELAKELGSERREGEL